MSITLETEDLEPLKIKCITALCDRDLHCFLRTRKAAQKAGGGPCRKCGKELVDFADRPAGPGGPRLHVRTVEQGDDPGEVLAEADW